MGEENITKKNGDLEELPGPTEKNRTPTILPNEFDDVSDELLNVSDIPVNEGSLNAERVHIDYTSNPANLKVPRMRMSQPEYKLAKLPISQRHQKKVLKNVTRLTEKLQKMGLPDSPFVWKDRNQAFTIRIRYKPAQAATGLDTVVYEVSTSEDGHTLTTEVYMWRLAFSSFAHFVDYWDPWVAVHDDEIVGRFHTNSGFSISQDRRAGPKFHGDGSYSWKTESSQKSELRRTIPNCAYYIVGGRKGKIHVKGIIKGKVLVYSEGDIIIDDDLFYSGHPEVSNNTDDFLGLVSQKDIKIAHPSVTGPGDLNIHAAIYAKRRFRISHLHGNGKALLTIHGSLSAGSLSATEPRYATRVVFDERLETHRPPNFPMTDHYEIIEWDREWTVNHSHDL